MTHQRVLPFRLTPLLLLGLIGCMNILPEAESPINFITQKPTASGGMDALLEGKLILSKRCLYLENSEGYGRHAAIWPYGYSFSSEEAGITIMNARAQIAARLGDTLRVGGGGVPNLSDEAFAENYLGDGQCSAPYWIVADVVEVITP
jgi:hypothetical protein